MESPLNIIAGVVITLSLLSLCLIHFLVRYHPESYLRILYRNKFGLETICLFAAALCYIAIIYLGIHQLLFWLPEDWGNYDDNSLSGRSKISVIFATLAFFSIGNLEKAARSETNARVIKSVDYLFSRIKTLIGTKDNEFDNYFENISDLREEDAEWIKEKALRLRTEIYTIISTAKYLEEEKVKKEIDAKAMKIHSKLFKQRMEDKSALMKCTRELGLLESQLDFRLPIITDLPNHDKNGCFRIDPEIVKENWTLLTEIFSALKAPTKQGVNEAFTNLTSSISGFSGIYITNGVEVFAHYNGNSHGGLTNLIAKQDGHIVEGGFFKHVNFTMTIDGVCAAFYLAHIAPLYGRSLETIDGYDYSIYPDRSSFLKKIDYYPSSLERGPGLHILRSESSLLITALGYGNTTGLVEFSVELHDGFVCNVGRKIIQEPMGKALY